MSWLSVDVVMVVECGANICAYRYMVDGDYLNSNRRVKRCAIILSRSVLPKVMGTTSWVVR